MKLDQFTWPQVVEYLEKNDRLIIPAGTCEQHGRHLPLASDTLLAEYVAHQLSELTGILVAPAINYGVNLPADRNFAGTTSLSEGTLKQLLTEIIDWWRQQGFNQFFILSAHGDPLHIQALNDVGSHVHVFQLYELEYDGILEKQTCARHAGEAETSVMLHLFPQLVRMDAAQDFDYPLEKLINKLQHTDNEPIPDSPGNIGFPTAASADKGQKIVQLMIDLSYRWIKKSLSGRSN